jgi:hypothetical protein
MARISIIFFNAEVHLKLIISLSSPYHLLTGFIVRACIDSRPW